MFSRRDSGLNATLKQEKPDSESTIKLEILTLRFLLADCSAVFGKVGGRG